jgi:hypothetical protein
VHPSIALDHTNAKHVARGVGESRDIVCDSALIIGFEPLVGLDEQYVHALDVHPLVGGKWPVETGEPCHIIIVEQWAH